MPKRHASASRKSSAYAVQIAQSLPAKPKDAVAYICEAFSTWREQFEADQHPQDQNSEQTPITERYAEYMGFFALLNMHSESLQLNVSEPIFTGNKAQDIQSIIDFFSQVRHELALMTLDLSLLSSLSLEANDNEVARFHKITDNEKSTVADLCHALHTLVQADDISDAAQQSFGEKYSILQEQFSHAVIDLNLAWRFVSQASMILDTQKDTHQAVDLLRSLSSELWRIQARKDKLPESTLKSIVMKLTHPARWEAESVAGKTSDDKESPEGG